MKGTILTFDKHTNKGLISGHDGNRYEFSLSDWTEKKTPLKGQQVDFESEEKMAKSIILIPSLLEERSRIAAALFALFLGGFGVHKFYLGQTGLGIIYLLFFWTLIPAIAAFIEFIILLTMSEQRFQEKFCK